MSETVNPYSAPTARVEDAGADSDAEATRRAHISRETSVRSVGSLYYILGVLLLVGTFGIATKESKLGEQVAMAALMPAVAAGLIAVGWGVRRYKSWARTVSCLISCVGLLALPIGTLFNAYILYIYFSKKGRTVFTPDYQVVIAATPHIRYRRSIVIRILLWLLAALVVIAASGRARLEQ